MSKANKLHIEGLFELSPCWQSAWLIWVRCTLRALSIFAKTVLNCKWSLFLLIGTPFFIPQCLVLVFQVRSIIMNPALAVDSTKDVAQCSAKGDWNSFWDEEGISSSCDDLVTSPSSPSLLRSSLRFKWCFFKHLLSALPVNSLLLCSLRILEQAWEGLQSYNEATVVQCSIRCACRIRDVVIQSQMGALKHDLPEGQDSWA